MKIKDFFTQNGGLNFEVLMSIPEFRKLKDCPQSQKWHFEGNVLRHILFTYNRFIDILNEYYSTFTCKLSNNDLLILKTAVLFHDIGKSITTIKDKYREGVWHAHGHDIASEVIVRRLLCDEEPEIREKVCALVRCHMAPLKYGMDSLLKEKSKIIPLTWLFYIKLADMTGSIQIVDDFYTDAIALLDFKKYANKISTL